MINTYTHLFLEFFKVGLFSFGGGYATLPFLYHISDIYGWYSANDLSQMLAVSSLTPGPVGINVATFAGFKTAGFFGALIATASIMMPSYFIVIAISKLLNKFKENFYVQSALYALRPASCGLLASVGINLLRHNISDIRGVVLFLILFAITFKYNRNPLIYLGIAALAGLLIG